MVLIFIGLLVGVVFVIALNERVNEEKKQQFHLIDIIIICFLKIAISARKELLDNIRQNPNEENDFRHKMNGIQKRVKYKRKKKKLFSLNLFLASLLWY